MAVYRYTGTIGNSEEIVETGTVVAKTEDEARRKLSQMDLKELRLKRITGVASLFKQFSADVR